MDSKTPKERGGVQVSRLLAGDPPTQLVDVPPVIYLANDIATTLEQVTRALLIETGRNRQ